MGCGASTAAAGDVKTAAVAPLRGEEKAASLNAEAFEEDGDQLGALPGEAPAAMKNFGNAIEDRHAGAGGGALVKDADGATRRITKVRGHILSDSEHFFLIDLRSLRGRVHNLEGLV